MHIDVPATSDIGPRLNAAQAGDALALGATRFRGSEYQNLTTSGVSYVDMDSTAVASTMFEALAGWRHRDPRMVNVPIEKGAGQYRSVGALVALATRGRIAQGLQRAYNQLQGIRRWLKRSASRSGWAVVLPLLTRFTTGIYRHLDDRRRRSWHDP